MRSGQLLFVILFIIAITVFSFLREKKKKPRVLFFGAPFQNKAGLITQMQKIAGYAYDFSWQSLTSSESAGYFESVEKSIHAVNPKAVFLYIDLSVSILINGEYKPVNLLPFENFCRRNALSLQEKRILLVIILQKSATPQFEMIAKIFNEYALPFINLDEIFEQQNSSQSIHTLSQQEIEKLASKAIYLLDTVS